MIEDRFVVSDELWTELERQLSGKASVGEVTAKDNHLFLEAIFWRDQPHHFWNQINQFCRFRRWAKSSVFEILLKAMSDDTDFEQALIDDAIVSVH